MYKQISKRKECLHMNTIFTMKGLPNKQNTCYFNSVMQSILNCKHALTYLHTYVDIHNLLNIHDNYDNVLLTIQQALPCINMHEQNDVHEFLMLYIDHMYEQCNAKIILDHPPKLSSSYMKLNYKCDKLWFSKYSPILDLYYNQLVIQTQCSQCTHVNLNLENECIIQLDIQDSYDSLSNALYRFFDNHTLDDWKCDKCSSSVNNVRIQRIWRLPKILIICIKRFKYMENEMSKISSDFELPFVLDMEKYTLKLYDNYCYKLSSVINHYGQPYYGHYNVDILKNDEIIKIDDKTISNIKNIDTKNNYICFYESITG